MQGTTRRGSGLCMHRVDQGSAVAAGGCCGGSGTVGSGLRAHGRATGLRSLSLGRGGEQGTGTAGAGHW